MPWSPPDLGSNPFSDSCRACELGKLTPLRLHLSVCKMGVIKGTHVKYSAQRFYCHQNDARAPRDNDCREDNIKVSTTVALVMIVVTALAIWQAVELRPARSDSPEVTGQRPYPDS